MKVALLSDWYLPRLGGIAGQVHDLAARLRDYIGDLKKELRQMSAATQ